MNTGSCQAPMCAFKGAAPVLQLTRSLSDDCAGTALTVANACSILLMQAFGSGDRFGLMTWTTTATIVMTLLGVVMSGAIW